MQGVLEKAVAAEVTARDQLRKREDQLLAKRELVAEKEAKLRQMEEKLQVRGRFIRNRWQCTY